MQSPYPQCVGLCQNVAKVPASSFPWRGQIVVLSHLRYVAGVGVLAASLLMGSAAVAVADPDSSNSAASGHGGANASAQGSTTTSRPVGDVTDTQRKKIQRVTSTLGSGRQAGQQPSTGAKSPKKEPGGTDTTDGTNDNSDLSVAVADPVAAVATAVAPGSDPVAAVATEVTPGSDPVAAVATAVAPGSDPVAAVATEVTPGSDPVAAVANEVAPGSVAVAPVADVAGPVSDVSALVQHMLIPVAGAVVPLTQLQSDLYSFLLGNAGVTPVPNIVSALVQDMLRSMAGAVVLLTQLPADLSSFLLGLAGAPPVVGEVAGIDGPGLSAAAGASVGSQLRLGPPLAGVSAVPLASLSGLSVTGEATTGVATLDVIALGRVSAASTMASPAPDAATPIGAGSSFRHVVGAVLLSVSLWALAAAALPGTGGLGFLTLAGVRLGYRQAKAGFALRAAGIAFFARPGIVPLGVVRSGSLVVIRPRALRVVRPGALSAEHLLDKVA